MLTSHRRAVCAAFLLLACSAPSSAQTSVNQSGPFPSGFTFIDEEIPAGVVDGVNTVFALNQTPNAPSSVAVYLNGLRMRRNLDYTLSGSQITFSASQVPQPGDVLMSSYRIGGNTATFLQTDTVTQGNWAGVYGADGYSIANVPAQYPAYAQVNDGTPATLLCTWASATDDIRATLTAPLNAPRIASTYYQDTTFAFDVNLTDGASHQLALYFLDWDQLARAETIDILDAATHTVVATRNISGFQQGQYLVWSVTGHVLIRVTLTGGRNAVLSGLFFN